MVVSLQYRDEFGSLWVFRRIRVMQQEAVLLWHSG